MLWEMTNVVTFYSGGKEISAFPGNVPARRLRKSKLRKKRVFSTGTRTINPFLISQPQMIDTGSFFSHTVALHSPPCPHMYLFNFILVIRRPLPVSYSLPSLLFQFLSSSCALFVVACVRC